MKSLWRPKGGFERIPSAYGPGYRSDLVQGTYTYLLYLLTRNAARGCVASGSNAGVSSTVIFSSSFNTKQLGVCFYMSPAEAFVISMKTESCNQSCT